MSTTAVAVMSTQPLAPNAPKKKRQHRCGTCKQSGHNRKTCPMRNVTTERGSRPVSRKLEDEFMDAHAKANANPTEHHEHEHEHEHEHCSICFESCNDNQQACCQLECKHKFHTSCIFKWMSKNNSCPLCRKKANQHHKPEIRMPSTDLMWILTNDSQLQEQFPNTTRLEWCEMYHYLRHEINNMSQSTLQSYEVLAPAFSHSRTSI
jgi:hypothetical protein